MAEILSHTEDTISVHYESWNVKYDEPYLSKSCARLATFRSRTIGYTGPKTVNRKFKYSNKVNNTHIAKLKELITFDSAFKFSAVEITEYIRGDLFLYVDSLLAMMHVFKPTLTEMNEILHFFDNFLSFTFKWIKEFPKVRKEYEKSKEYPNLYLTSARAAVARCYPELFELIGACFHTSSIHTSESFKVIPIINK